MRHDGRLEVERFAPASHEEVGSLGRARHLRVALELETEPDVCLMEVELPERTKAFRVVVGAKAPPELVLSDRREAGEPVLEQVPDRREVRPVDAVEEDEKALGSRRWTGVSAFDVVEEAQPDLGLDGGGAKLERSRRRIPF